jgi:hypothetical protein
MDSTDPDQELYRFVTQPKVLSRGGGGGGECVSDVMPKNRGICGLAVASVADPGCLSPIPDSQIFSIPDPGFASKNRLFIPDPDHGSGSLFFYPSRIPDQG